MFFYACFADGGGVDVYRLADFRQGLAVVHQITLCTPSNHGFENQLSHKKIPYTIHPRISPKNQTFFQKKPCQIM